MFVENRMYSRYLLHFFDNFFLELNFKPIKYINTLIATLLIDEKHIITKNIT